MTDLSASDLARRLVELESRGHGDVEGAIRRAARRAKVSFWQLSHLRGGRAKSCDVSLFQKLRSAYLDVCERQVQALQLEIAREKARGSDDALADIETETLALVAEVARRKERG